MIEKAERHILIMSLDCIPPPFFFVGAVFEALYRLCFSWNPQTTNRKAHATILRASPSAESDVTGHFAIFPTLNSREFLMSLFEGAEAVYIYIEACPLPPAFSMKNKKSAKNPFL